MNTLSEILAMISHEKNITDILVKDDIVAENWAKNLTGK